MHVFPYQAYDAVGPPRTQDLVAQHSREAFDSGSAVMGVKGPSWLSSLKYIDIVCGSMIDYMHTVLLGVCRGLLYLWFDGQHRSEPWYRGGLQQAVDGRLTSIKPPSCITRTPRSVSEKKTWKANEFRAWLLHYSLPVMRGILPDMYFLHYLLLVHTIYLLLQSSISPEDVNSAELVLCYFHLPASETTLVHYSLDFLTQVHTQVKLCEMHEFHLCTSETLLATQDSLVGTRAHAAIPCGSNVSTVVLQQLHSITLTPQELPSILTCNLHHFFW